MKKRRLNIFLIFMMFIAAVFLVSLVKEWAYIAQIREQKAVVETRLQKVTEENKRLKAEKAALQTPKYIEKVAREELGMTKKGEVPYISSAQK